MNDKSNLFGICFLSIFMVALCGTPVRAQTEAVLFLNVGLSNFQAGKFTVALTNFTNAIELNTNLSPAYFWQGMAKYEIKDYKGAIAAFNRVIKSEVPPGNVYVLGDAYNQRGRSKFGLEDWPGAIIDFNKAIELEPKIAETYYNRGLAKAHLKNFVEAVADYTKAIELKTDPHGEDIFFWRGNAKMEIKDFVGAIADSAKVTKSNSNFELARTNFAIAKEALRDSKKQ